MLYNKNKMDPWYFLDISLQNEDELDLHEYSEHSYDGSWIIESKENKLVYDNNVYDIIQYNNETKLISFWNNNQEILNFKINIPKQDRLNKNKIIEQIVEIIDNSKETLNDLSYIEIMDYLKNEYN